MLNEFVIFMISWLLAGSIAGVIRGIDRDFQEIYQKAQVASGLSSKKLFTLTILCSFAMGILFGYYSLYEELKYQLSKRKL